ncbi:uncharacterized protein FFMR_06419 [Fusarium fujikuroi]|nr:uncharacterized protein FFM5_06659 [Fusarium fujikuroi]SCO41519.1 uncharacterized protein FFMR_06419 [Fusarium fujikuroi]
MVQPTPCNTLMLVFLSLLSLGSEE